MGESMKELNCVTRICIKQNLIVWRLKMQDDYSLHSVNQDAIEVATSVDIYSSIH